MKIKKVEKLDDCLNSHSIKEVYFDSPIKKEHVKKMSALGKLEFYESFPRPFFRIISRDYQVKGIAGDLSIRVTLNHKQGIGPLLEDITRLLHQ